MEREADASLLARQDYLGLGEHGLAGGCGGGSGLGALPNHLPVRNHQNGVSHSQQPNERSMLGNKAENVRYPHVIVRWVQCQHIIH